MDIFMGAASISCLCGEQMTVALQTRYEISRLSAPRPFGSSQPSFYGSRPVKVHMKTFLHPDVFSNAYVFAAEL
jgi:hypothetical protein